MVCDLLLGKKVVKRYGKYFLQDLTTRDYKSWLAESTGVFPDNTSLDELQAFALRMKSMDNIMDKTCATKIVVLPDVEGNRSAVVVVWHQSLEHSVQRVVSLLGGLPKSEDDGLRPLTWLRTPRAM